MMLQSKILNCARCAGMSFTHVLTQTKLYNTANSYKKITLNSSMSLLIPDLTIMGNYQQRCMSKIYTKTGDGGSSSLFTGERRPKSDNLFEALGDIDELSCNIGLAREILGESWQQENFQEVGNMLQKVQCALQDVASCVATPLPTATEKQIIRTEFDQDLVDELEEWIDYFSADLPELKNFILPSGGQGSCTLHISRSVCRRAERKVAPLVLQNDINPAVAKYINRLSDFLFTVARHVAYMEGKPEVIYKKPKRKKQVMNDASKDNSDSNKKDS